MVEGRGKKVGEPCSYSPCRVVMGLAIIWHKKELNAEDIKANHTQGLDLSSETSIQFVDGLASTLNGQMRDVENEVLRAVDAQMDGREKRALVILDGLDFLLAALGADAGEALDMVGEIREVSLVSFNSL